MIATHSHIVTIQRKGVIEGHQLRVDGGGAGKSWYFSSGKYGGPELSRLAAEKTARDMRLPKTLPPGGHIKEGRLTKLNRTGAAGIRFGWIERQMGPVLTLVATWTDHNGRSRHRVASVERHGLTVALDKVIAARTSSGAALPDRLALLALLRRVYETGAAGQS